MVIALELPCLGIESVQAIVCSNPKDTFPVFQNSSNGIVTQAVDVLRD